MTEAEWLIGENPDSMLDYLRSRMTERKERLFVCAVCRRYWNQLSDERSRMAVAAAERHADGEVSDQELEAIANAACKVWNDELRQAELSGDDSNRYGEPLTFSSAAYNAAIPMGWWGGAPAFDVPNRIVLSATHEPDAERFAQCIDLRDIFGNPFRPVAVESHWLTPAVRDLAAAIYAGRAFDRLPVLADALEEAGCGHANILAHCRGPGPHVRGCWVVDLILGKS